MRRIFALLLWLGAVSAALAQTPTGSECWDVIPGTGSAPGICYNTVRGGTVGVGLTIAASFQIGDSATTAPIINGGNLLVTAQPLAATITLPANSVVDGTIIGYCNVSSGAFATNAVTFAANANQTLNTAVTLTTQAAGTCAKVQWNQADGKWYRVQ